MGQIRKQGVKSNPSELSIAQTAVSKRSEGKMPSRQPAGRQRYKLERGGSRSLSRLLEAQGFDGVHARRFEGGPEAGRYADYAQDGG